MSIVLEDVSYIYNPDGADHKVALDHVSLEIPADRFIGLVGHTGSGKSTLVQLMNGLLKPTTGQVSVDGVSLHAGGAAGKAARQSVGLVFQYPEHQLFEETVAKDIAFGPKNQGLSEQDQQARVQEAMQLVGLEYEQFKDKSPFELSGGQKRRVAIAGVLAMHPRYLIMDEPTAGLDPLGRDRILESIEKLHEETDMSVILVSHSMDDVAQYADHIIVMNDSRLFLQGDRNTVFADPEQLRAIGLGVPALTALMFHLQRHGFSVPTDIFTLDEARAAIEHVLHEKKGG